MVTAGYETIKEIVTGVIIVLIVQEVWLLDIVERCILGLDALNQLGATVNNVTKQLC